MVYWYHRTRKSPLRKWLQNGYWCLWSVTQNFTTHLPQPLNRCEIDGCLLMLIPVMDKFQHCLLVRLFM